MTSERIYSMVGNSMNPTLLEPMILETIRVDRYYLGDVIVFKNKSEKAVVHRIIKLTQTGFITRGDNNLIDDEPIIYDDIVGKVVAAFRGEKRYKVHCYKYGYLLHHYLQIRKILLQYFLFLFTFGYRLLSRLGIFIKLLPNKYKPRIIQYKREQAHLYIGKILVGRYDVRCHRWIIYRPWRIFIDEKLLPIPNA
ncbi:MAG: signal peptidase I [Bacteroidetes bacterium]|nr:signal peptidase I [Bacteroidota bacterium]